MLNDPMSVLNSEAEFSRRCFRGTLVGLTLFAALGTVTAVWVNPFFIRKVPVGAWELAATAVTAILAGVTATFWVPKCRMRKAGAGGIASFVGIACPVCNKVLLLIFGGPFLLAWFDPLRPYLATGGVIVMGFAAIGTVRAYRELHLPFRVLGAERGEG